VSTSDLFGQALKIEVERHGEQLRLVLSGDLDISSAARLEEALQAAEAAQEKAICLDLRELSFIDSMGLRAILSAQLRLSVDGDRLTLIPGCERVQRVFAMTRTTELLHFEDGDAPPDNGRALPGRRETD
jgi:anti-sigma B factor antagonist